MNPQFSFLSFLFITFILLHIPRSSCADDEQYVNCGQLFQCGTISNIGYPFWGGTRPSYCGHPGFELNCSTDALQLTIESRTYRVLAIQNTTRDLTVVREEFWNNTCPTNLYNATLDTTIFNYSSNSQDLTLYYGCEAVNVSGVINQFNCGTNISYYVTRNVTTSNFNVGSPACDSSVIVRVNQAAADALANVTPSITIREALSAGFGLQWANDTDCQGCVGSGGRCGYNSNSSSFACYCSDQPHELVCGSSKRGLNHWLKIAIGISTSVAGLILISILMICCIRKKYLWAKNDQNVEAFFSNYGSHVPKRYNYSDIKRMTNSFRDKLGKGGYGVVYKGKLLDGQLVAVKVLSETKGNGEDFINEVASISRTSHVNVVTLLGFCYERNKRALVYEFMSNGSLDKFIQSNGSQNLNCHLDCKTLYQIAVGVARGLEYLHRGCNTRIVHFDIKPQNILLDDDFCPKIADFGLAKLGQRKKSIMSMVGARGTIGYIAPEVFSRNFGEVSHKSDVYSYGMTVLDMVGQRKDTEVGRVHSSEIYFPDCIYEQLEHIEDLDCVTSEEEKETAKRMIIVSLWCIQTNPEHRPSMTSVVEMLEGNLQSLQIPPKPILAMLEGNLPSLQNPPKPIPVSRLRLIQRFSPLKLTQNPPLSLIQSI